MWFNTSQYLNLSFSFVLFSHIFKCLYAQNILYLFISFSKYSNIQSELIWMTHFCKWKKCLIKNQENDPILHNWAANSENVPLTCVPSKDLDQLTHSCSLIKIFTGHMLDSQGCKVSSCRQWKKLIRLVCLCWAHMSEGMFSHVVAQL